MLLTTNRCGVRLWGVLCVLLALSFWAGAGHGALTVEPSALVFQNREQAETVRLFADGQPLPGGAVTSWRLLVDERNYSHMLRVSPADDGIRITPSDTAEIGSYLLVLRTARGEAAIRVYTPFTDYQSSIEALAQRMDVSIEEVRRQMGLTRRLGREQITMTLSPVHYLGQHIKIVMPGTDDRVSVWEVNGEEVLRGVDAHRFSHVAETTGPLLVAYHEYEDGTLIASANGLTEVVIEPAIPHTVTAGAHAHFEAPPGFATYRWKVDGEAAGSGATLRHVFDTPGRYMVKVIATDPTDPGPYGFRETRYEVTVTTSD